MRNRNLKAATLVEVIVVMAVVSILAGVLIVSLRGGRVTKELEASAREFTSVVREAQNYALTGKQIAGNDTCSFSVEWTGGSSRYEMKYAEAGNCGTSQSVPGTVYNLKQRVTFGGGSGSRSITFILPWANVSGTTTVSFQKSGSFHVVCISDRTGKISDQPGTICP